MGKGSRWLLAGILIGCGFNHDTQPSGCETDCEDCDDCVESHSSIESFSLMTHAQGVSDAEGMDFLLADVMPDQARQDITTILVGVGEKESAVSTEPATPVTGADIDVAWDDTGVSPCDLPGSSGIYQVSSVAAEELCVDEDLLYVVGSEYTTTIETGGETYTLEVIAPSPLDAEAVLFAPAFDGTEIHLANLFHHTLGAALDVDWSGDANTFGRFTFVTLLRINYSGGDDDLAFYEAENWELDANNPIYDDTPRELVEMLEVVALEATSSRTIPSSAFDEEGLYILLLTSTELSQDTEGLGIFSGALAGDATVWSFWVD